MAGCGAETRANELMVTLLDGKDFDLPDFDLTGPEYQSPVGSYPAVDNLTNENLTTRTVDGSGTFDALMSSVSAHTKREYDQNRITGQEYSKTYIAAMGAALGASVQFLLGRDQAYWGAVLARSQAEIALNEVVKSRIELVKAKAELAIVRIQAENAEAEYALTKMKIATEDANYCLIQNQIAQGVFTLEQVMPLQKLLTNEQYATQYAQTHSTLPGNVPVSGVLGKQISLWEQQIISYKRDADVKIAKIFADAFIAQKTIDEGIEAPNNFTKAEIDKVMAKLRFNNDMVLG